MLLRQRNKTNILGVLMTAVALAVIVSTPSFAQASKTNTANTLKIAPVRSDITINPGETKSVPVTVTNLTASPISVRPSANDFVAGDERGTPALILDDTKFAPTHSLKRFMQPLKDTVIPAKKATTFNVIIKVPKDAQAGGYFGALRFSPSSPDTGGEVNLSASVASLLLATVTGPVTEKLNMTNFEIQQNKKTGTHFQSSNDLSALVRFENKGGLQIGPFGKLFVKQGDKVVYETDFNENTPREMILPDSARRWDIPLKNIGSFGNYTVSAVFSYGSKNETITIEKSFWVIPQLVIFATIGGVVLLILLIVGIWLFLRNYKRRVLRSHGGGHRGGFRR